MAYHRQLLLGVGVALVTPAAVADDGPEPSAPATPPPAGLALVTNRLSTHGFIDVYYALNANDPADDSNFPAGMGTTAKRAHEVGLSYAALALSYAPAPFGAELMLIYGTGAEVVHSTEPAGTGVGLDVWRSIGRASLTFQQGALSVEAGIYPSYLGYEGLYSKDNWTYTRGWLAENSPYYLAGLKVAYAFTDNLSAQLHVMNGWQVIGDNNGSKALGAQLLWAPDGLRLTLNTFLGPETANDDSHWRFFGEIVAEIQPAAGLGLAAELDAGLQQRAGADASGWQGAGLFARYAVTPMLAVVLRGEIYRDPDGTITGVGETAEEATLCVELKPAGGFSLKVEGRYDHSDAPVFALHDTAADGKPILGRDQALLVVGGVASF